MSPPRRQPRRASAACGLARALHAAIVGILLLAPQSTFAQATRSRREKPAIQRAIDLLTEEAQQAQKDQKLTRAEADFASRFKDEIPTDALLDALTQRVHRSAFIDAYVRWQLTSFNPPLPELDDRQFLKLMANAPALVSNPCADEEPVAAFEKAEALPKMSPHDLQRARRAWDELQHQRQAIQSMNEPALQWRKWIDDHLPARGPRKLQWLIERCASTISAGWEARDAKGDLTRACRELGRSAGDLGLSPQQKQMVSEQMQRMQGLRRRVVEDVAFLAGDRIDVAFMNVYVSDNDIEKWTGLLNGEDRS
jgi:hypothetical protein